MTTSKKIRDLRATAATSRGPGAVGIAGRGGWSRIRQPTPAELGAQVRQFVWGQAGRLTASGAQRDKMILAMVRQRFPGSVAVLGSPAILSLLRHPRDGTCGWCIATVLATGGPEPPPDSGNEAQAALLGRACAACRGRWRQQAAVERARAETAAAQPARGGRREAITAAGQPAPGEPAATGMLWPAGQEPPGLVAALRAAGQSQHKGRPR